MHRAVVLLSGGLDSLACATFYLSRGVEVTALFVDYGQRASKLESIASRRIARDLDIPIRRLSVNLGKFGPGKIVGRNAMLLTLALMIDGAVPRTLALGIHAGTEFEDCSPTFLTRMQAIADLYSAGKVRVEAPFLDWTKRKVFEFLQHMRVSTQHTYSCERGGKKSCGRCLSCRDVRALNGN